MRQDFAVNEAVVGSNRVELASESVKGSSWENSFAGPLWFHEIKCSIGETKQEERVRQRRCQTSMRHGRQVSRKHYLLASVHVFLWGFEER